MIEQLVECLGTDFSKVKEQNSSFPFQIKKLSDVSVFVNDKDRMLMISHFFVQTVPSLLYLCSAGGIEQNVLLCYQLQEEDFRKEGVVAV